MKKNSGLINNKEYSKQMRENCVKENGIVKVSEEMWLQLADMIENAILAPCKVGDTVYTIRLRDRKILKGTVIAIFKNENIGKVQPWKIEVWFDDYYDDAPEGSNYGARIYFKFEDVGEGFFLNEDDAEKAKREGMFNGIIEGI